MPFNWFRPGDNLCITEPVHHWSIFDENIKPQYFMKAKSIPCLLMPWLFVLPRHQQHIVNCKISWSSMNKHFNCLHNLDVGNNSKCRKCILFYKKSVHQWTVPKSFKRLVCISNTLLVCISNITLVLFNLVVNGLKWFFSLKFWKLILIYGNFDHPQKL